MRILFISDVYFPRVNGVSTSIRTFMRALGRLGHEVTLIAPDYGDNGPADPRVIRIPARVVPFDPEDRFMQRDAIRARTDALRAQGFDVVHVHTPFVAHYAGLALARALGVPVIESYHTFFEEYLFHYVPLVPRAWMRALARRFSRAQCNDVDAVVVPSRPMREVLEGYGIRTRMEIIPTGMELDRFRGGDGARFRAKHRISRDRPLLLHVGRVAHEKNIEFLLRVVERVRLRVPGVLLVIAGEGPALPALRAAVRALGIEFNVMFIGYMDRDTQLLDCYRAADAKIFASRTETQGLVLLEAMALGVPVISTAVMGTRDVLAAGCGAVVVDEDEDEFARAVVRVLGDATLRARMARDSVDYVRGWSADVMAARLAGLCDAVAPQREEVRRQSLPLPAPATED
jgi:glycosyltransferase involved in cell wall biosynthesis